MEDDGCVMRMLGVNYFVSVIPRLVKSCRQRLATVAMFLRSCVVQASSRGDGPRHALHASTQYRECNEDLILGVSLKQYYFLP